MVSLPLFFYCTFNRSAQKLDDASAFKIRLCGQLRSAAVHFGGASISGSARFRDDRQWIATRKFNERIVAYVWQIKASTKWRSIIISKTDGGSVRTTVDQTAIMSIFVENRYPVTY